MHHAPHSCIFTLQVVTPVPDGVHDVEAYAHDHAPAHDMGVAAAPGGAAPRKLFEPSYSISREYLWSGDRSRQTHSRVASDAPGTFCQITSAAQLNTGAIAKKVRQRVQRARKNDRCNNQPLPPGRMVPHRLSRSPSA